MGRGIGPQLRCCLSPLALTSINPASTSHKLVYAKIRTYYNDVALFTIMNEQNKIKIEFYFPARYADNTKIPKSEFGKLMHIIQRKFKGSTTSGKGYYQQGHGDEHPQKVYVLSTIAPITKSVLKKDLPKFKAQIKTELNQTAVLITYHPVTETR